MSGRGRDAAAADKKPSKSGTALVRVPVAARIACWYTWISTQQLRGNAEGSISVCRVMPTERLQGLSLTAVKTCQVRSKMYLGLGHDTSQ